MQWEEKNCKQCILNDNILKLNSQVLTGIKPRWVNSNKSVKLFPFPPLLVWNITHRGIGEGDTWSFSSWPHLTAQLSNFPLVQIWVQTVIQMREGLAQSWQMQITDRNNENKCPGGMVASQKWIPFFSVRLSIMWPSSAKKQVKTKLCQSREGEND